MLALTNGNVWEALANGAIVFGPWRDDYTAVESGDPAGTSNPEEALMDDNGNPVPNSARDTQLTAAGLVTSLSLAAMSIGISYGIIAVGVAFALLGIVIAGLGYALLGLITPEVAARFGIEPVAN